MRTMRCCLKYLFYIIEAYSFSICRVKEFMRLMAVRLAQELVIKLLDLRIVM